MGTQSDPQGKTCFAPYQNYQQPYGAPAGQLGNQWNTGGQNQGPYGQNPYGQNPMGPIPSRQNQWGQPLAGWNPGTPSYS